MRHKAMPVQPGKRPRRPGKRPSGSGKSHTYGEGQGKRTLQKKALTRAIRARNGQNGSKKPEKPLVKRETAKERWIRPQIVEDFAPLWDCLLYTSPSPRDS